MYSEYEDRKRYPIRDFLIKLVLVIIFVLLLVWLLPTSNDNLKGLTDRIFNANIQTMKEAAIPYYTTERLPQKVGESKKMTLQQMIDLKLLLPFTDKNGNSCDTKASYVEITKKSDEYELKVNLKCGEEENYIIVHVGCYSFCEADICEKEKSESPETNPNKKVPSTVIQTVISGPSCELQISGGNRGDNGWYLGDVTVSFKHKITTTSGAKITHFGLTPIATATYNSVSSHKVNKDGITKIYGYVKDSNGKTAICSIEVKRDTVAPTCTVGVLSGIKDASGNYVSDVTAGLTSSTDATSGVDRYGMGLSANPAYNSQKQLVLKNNGSFTVYGYVKDKAGHVQKCSIPIKIAKDPNKPIASVPSCTLEVKQGTLGLNSWYRTNVTVGFKTAGSTNGAQIVKYGIGTSEVYNQQLTSIVNKEGHTTLKGYVQDSNGYKAVCSITVKKDSVKPSCALAVQSGTYNPNGYYTSAVTLGFQSRYDATSGIFEYGLGKELNYNKATKYSISNDGTHLVYGFVKDNAGNVNLCSIKIIKKAVAYEYQYSKEFATVYGNWSAWTKQEYVLSNKPKFEKTATKETEDLGATTTTTYKYSVGEPILATTNKYYGSVTKNYCEGFNYYQTQTKTTTTSGAIVTTTRDYAVKTSEDSWTYVGLVRLSNPPTDTLSTKYVFVAMDWSACDNCLVTPYTTWKKYTRNVGTVTSTTTSTGTVTEVSVNINGVVTKCSNLVSKKVDLYLQEQTIVGYTTIKVPETVTKYYYQTRTRAIVQNAYTDYKWSVYNDTNLLNQGYKLTGNKRTVG